MNEAVEYKQFVQSFALFVGVVVVLVGSTTFALYTAGIPYSENDLLLTYQMQKLASSSAITTIIVGDSSAGNAISADLFTKQTGRSTVSLALTGSYGIEGSYNMIRQALRTQPSLKYVVIVQTLDVWHRPLEVQGVIASGRGVSLCAFASLCTHPLAMAKYFFNPKQIEWALYSVFIKPPQLFIKDDYVVQRAEQYANGGTVPTDIPSLATRIDPSKIEAVGMIDRLCRENGLVCVYMHGPLHEDAVAQSQIAIAAIDAYLDAQQSLLVSHEVLALRNEQVGDSLDHVAVPYKSHTTLWYTTRFTEMTQDR